MSVCLQKKAIKRRACSPPCFPNSLHFILTIRNNLARHYPVMKPHRAWLFSSKEPPQSTHTHTHKWHPLLLTDTIFTLFQTYTDAQHQPTHPSTHTNTHTDRIATDDTQKKKMCVTLLNLCCVVWLVKTIYVATFLQSMGL